MWIGTIYCPILPLFGVFFDFFIFYSDRFALYHFSAHPRSIYNSNKQERYFLLILLLTLFAVLGPIGYVLTSLTASCGPHSGKPIYQIIPDLIKTNVNVNIQKAFLFLGSAGFIFPLLCFMIFIIFYFQSLSSKRFKREKYLEAELQAERREKKFLLATLPL